MLFLNMLELLQAHLTNELWEGICRFHICKITIALLYSCKGLFVPPRGERLVNNIYLLGGGIIVSILTMIALVIVLSKVRIKQRRKAIERILEANRESKQALVRYVMLNRQCSEDAAYHRLAIFIKKHIPLDDFSSIDRMLVYDKQKLLDTAQTILLDDPNEIDKI